MSPVRVPVEYKVIREEVESPTGGIKKPRRSKVLVMLIIVDLD